MKAVCNECGYEWDTSAKTPRCTQCMAYDVDVDGGSATAESTESSGSEEESTEDSTETAEESSGLGIITSEVEGEVETDAFSESETETETPEGSGAAEEEGIETVETQPEIDIEPEDIEAHLEVFFGVEGENSGVLSRSRGEHWELTETETERLSGIYARLIEKHAPAAGSEYMLEITAITMTASIMLPRMQEDKQKKEKEKKEEIDTESKDETDRTSGTVTDTIREGTEDDEEESTANNTQTQTSFDRL